MTAHSTGHIASLNCSTAKGTIKTPTDSAVLDQNGIVGDAHAGCWHRQVSLLSQETIAQFVAESGRETAPGEFAENLTIAGLDLSRAAVLDRFTIGDVELELTQVGKRCHGEGCDIYREVGKCIMPKEGVFCRVVTGGEIRVGDEIAYHPRPLKICVITLSDRAARSVYTDRSGPRAEEILREFFDGKRWHVDIHRELLPDDPAALDALLRQQIAGNADAVFTLGSTGAGPRDIAPEAMLAVSEKTIPGIVEHVRAKFGADKPAARLSRSVAALAGTTQLYALPGSVRAVEEYLGEILHTFEHLIHMIHAIDSH